MYVAVASPYLRERGVTPIYQYNDFEDDYEDEEMFYDRQRRFANPNPNRRDRILNPNRRSRFPNSICGKGGGYSNLNEFGISSFDGNLDFESSLL